MRIFSRWMQRPPETMEAKVEIASYRLMDEILKDRMAYSRKMIADK